MIVLALACLLLSSIAFGQNPNIGSLNGLKYDSNHFILANLTQSGGTLSIINSWGYPLDSSGNLLIDCAVNCAGGSMVYPAGSGIPIVVSGTSWGTTVAAPTGAVVGTSDAQTLTNKSIAASEINSGTLAAAQMPALTGDATTSAGAVATTVGKVNGATYPAAGSLTTKSIAAVSGASAVTYQSVADVLTTDYVAGGGTAQAQTVTLAPAATALTSGLFVAWKPTAANTTSAPTLAVNGLTATAITKCGTTALVANDLTTAAVAYALYDGTQFQLLNPQSAGCGTASAGVSSFTGDGNLISNVGSTGATTVTLATATAHKWWGNNTAGTAAPGYQTIGAGDLPAALSSSTSVNGTTIPASSTLFNTGTPVAGGIAYGASITQYSTTSAGTTKQVVLSGGAGTPTMIDFPDVKSYPSANCVSTVAGAAWNTTLTPTCIAGTNNLGGQLPFVDASVAQFETEIPADWDSTSQPFVNLFFNSGTNTTGTVIFNVAVACTKSDGSITSDPAFNTADALATKTMAAATRTWSTSLQLTQVISGNNCVAGGTMLVKVTRATDTAASAVQVTKMTITTPRLLTVQAN